MCHITLKVSGHDTIATAWHASNYREYYAQMYTHIERYVSPNYTLHTLSSFTTTIPFGPERVVTVGPPVEVASSDMAEAVVSTRR